MTSPRTVGHALDVSNKTILRIFHEDRMHIYHLQRKPAKTHHDKLPRLNFPCSYIQETAGNQAFSAYVLFTDEAIVMRFGYV